MRNLRIAIVTVTGVAVAAAVVVAIIAVAIGVLAVRRHPDAAGAPSNLPRFASVAPLLRATGAVGDGISALADPAWVATTAKLTRIPARALEAYAGAAIRVSDEGAGCGIGWNTLAGIGEIESRHGTIFGGAIAPNGDATPPIFGVPLAGGTVANVPDSDLGSIDGDASIDRAVGPMQMIPEAWRNWHVDANGDGVQDPQNIDDATLAAAHYLCRASAQDMTSESGWRAGVLAYNHSDRYLADVIRYSTTYGADARR